LFEPGCKDLDLFNTNCVVVLLLICNPRDWKMLLMKKVGELSAKKLTTDEKIMFLLLLL
jgi:hypothetical protein